MRVQKTLFSCCIILCISAISYSQIDRPRRDVNKDIDVVRVYEQVVKEGYGTPFIYKKLASAYYFKSDYGKALTWFQKLFATEKNTDPELVQQYHQTVKAVAASNATGTH